MTLTVLTGLLNSKPNIYRIAFLESIGKDFPFRVDPFQKKAQTIFRNLSPLKMYLFLLKLCFQEEDLERCISESDQSDKCVVTASLPVRGEYGLEIYGNDPAKDGDTYTHICQYFVHFETPQEQAKAFYQESPERQKQAEPQATMEKQYTPDSQGVRYFLHSI